MLKSQDIVNMLKFSNKDKDKDSGMTFEHRIGTRITHEHLKGKRKEHQIKDRVGE